MSYVERGDKDSTGINRQFPFQGDGPTMFKNGWKTSSNHWGWSQMMRNGKKIV